MKNFLCCLIAISYFACQEPATETETAPPQMSSFTFEGTIENPASEEISLKKGEEKHIAAIENGQFRLEAPILEAGFYSFKHGNEHATIYLKPNDQLQLSMNAEQFDETMKFSGTGALENNYLISKLLLQESLNEDRKALFSKEETEFIAAHTSNTEQLKTHYESYRKANPDIDKAFFADEANQLLYTWANERLYYPSYHAYYTGNEDFKASDAYSNFLSEVQLDNENLLDNKAYKQFVTNYIDYRIEEGVNADDELSKMEELKAKFDLIQKEIKSEKVRNLALYNQMRSMVRYDGSNVTDEMIAQYKTLNTDEEFQREITETFESWAHLRPGMDAPAFAYTNIKGDTIALAALSGKNVYVDVWATWCGPCKRELPYLEKLQDTYKDNDHIVFASVSIDKDKAAWEKMVKEKDMKGVQVIGDKAWNSSICKDYNIKGIPRFLLIDKLGKIIDANAPRPSSKAIKTVLADLADPAYTSMK